MPGFAGSQPEWHLPPKQTFAPLHGFAASHAWHCPAPAVGRQTCSDAEGTAPHSVGVLPIGPQVVVVQPVHSPNPLQHARQYETLESALSGTHDAHDWQ